VRSSYLDQPVGVFLDALGAGMPAPAGGSAAALAVAQSAALCAMTARLSVRTLSAERADGLISSAGKLHRGAASLVDLDAEAYIRVISATRAARASPPDSASAAEDLAAAISHAADVPLQITELAVEVVSLATALASEGNQALRGDAITARLLAQAGGR
jgi:formiminotetrahydrofolate cyclodeaminase